jgi:hypothetical protein
MEVEDDHDDAKEDDTMMSSMFEFCVSAMVNVIDDPIDERDAR